MRRDRQSWGAGIAMACLALLPAMKASADEVPKRSKRVAISDAQLAYLAGFPNGFPDAVLGPLVGETMPKSMPGIDAQLRRVSLATPFLGVGELTSGNTACTGTWLGEQDQATYILTAAHCAGNRSAEVERVNFSFMGWDGTVLAQGEGWGHVPRAYFGNGKGWDRQPATDIAVLILPRRKTPTGHRGEALAQPLIYDGKQEAKLPVDFVGYGLLNDGKSAGRRWGRSTLSMVYSDWLASAFSAETRTEQWARVQPGDSGSPVWQPQAGYWSIVGAVSSKSRALDSYATRVSSHVDWLRSVYPGMRTLSDRLTVTATQPFLSRDLSRNVDRGAVYFTVPPQEFASGPQVRQSGSGSGYSRILVQATDPRTLKRLEIRLRGERSNGASAMLPMVDATESGARWNQLKVSFHAEDNPDLPLGRYETSFEVQAAGALATTFVQRFPVHVRISDREGLVTVHKSYQGPVAGGGKAYYTTSTPMVDLKSRHTYQGPGPQLAWAKVFSVADGSQHAVRLRVLHDSDCETENFRKEPGCHGYFGGRLTVSYELLDQGGLALPPGLYRGSTQFFAHKPEDGSLLEVIDLKIELDTRVKPR